MRQFAYHPSGLELEFMEDVNSKTKNDSHHVLRTLCSSIKN